MAIPKTLPETPMIYNQKSLVITVSIGICAHNEEQNIGKLLDALLAQETSVAEITQILVVSFSNDGTDEIVKRYQKKDSRVALISQSSRDGKAAAVNLFLQYATADVCVLESADTLPEKWTIDKLVEPFLEPKVGMTGGRPIPTNNINELMGYVSNLLWKVHHEISLADPENPKCGEIIAFRSYIKKIPSETAVDEASIEQIGRQLGFFVKYAKDAVVYNHGPETVSDFLKQRRRIHSGHLYLKKYSAYTVSTMKTKNLLKVLPKILETDIRKFPFFVSALFLEFYGRLLGTYDFYIRKRNPYVWDTVKSTKEL